MNLKSFLGGLTIGMVVIGGAVVCTKLISKDVEPEDNIVTGVIEQVNACNEEKREISLTNASILEIVNAEMKYQEEYKIENYEVVIKNTSARNLKKITFTLGEGVYELYDMLPDESYKIVAYNTEKDLSLKVLSVDYEIINYFGDEIGLNITNDGKKVTGTISNKGQRELYPGRIIFFLKDKDGYTIQKSVEYAGCFFEDLVINPGKTLDFEQDIPEGLLFNNSKSTIVEYSDLEFKSTDVRLFN